MASNYMNMGGPPDAGDQGDAQDQQMGPQDVQAELEDLEARVSAIEAKLGINSAADESESPMPAKKPATKLSGGVMPFLGA